MAARKLDSSYFAANRRLWDRLTPVHAQSAFYDVDGFRAGKSSLMPLELKELGAVSGKSLLHLQCHFGLDTLSWARRGALVTGVDFSPKAIALARRLARDLGLDARFVRANVYELPSVLEREFDIVFTSYGAICWLPDLWPWAETISHFLRPGGTFYMVEIHPVTNVFNGEAGAKALQVVDSYFSRHQPEEAVWQFTYADHDAKVGRVSYQWTHSLGEVVSALAAAGLRLEFLHEFPYCVYQHFPFMRRSADGWWRLPGRKPSIPLMFSLRATKR